jgi:aspartate/tyrosine/aromatic aminotransferase
MVVETILMEERLRSIWQSDVKHMAEQLRQRRRLLLEQLKRLGTPGDWNFVIDQSGMFWYVAPACVKN